MKREPSAYSEEKIRLRKKRARKESAAKIDIKKMK